MISAPTENGKKVLTMDEYIEREAVYEDFEKCNGENPKWTPSRVKALIARQKTADVAPVRHGRWIKNGVYYSCRKCGRSFHYRMEPQWWNYCPQCGDMIDK